VDLFYIDKILRIKVIDDTLLEFTLYTTAGVLAMS